MRSIVKLAVLCGIQVSSSCLAQSGIITTYAGADPALATSRVIDGAVSVAPDGSGGFYLTSNLQNRVYRISMDGRISVAAGNGVQGFSGDDGPAVSAELDGPWGICVDRAGNLYIADARNNRIRKVSTGGTISTVAGSGTAGFSGDGGSATAAALSAPWDVAVDTIGNLLIADTGNQRVRKVTAGGIISTLAGNGISGFSGDGGLAANAELWGPSGITVDASGSIFVADTGNQRIRKITGSGEITTVAGTGTYGLSGDEGAAVLAQLNAPWDVAVDGSGNLFIADTWNHRIRKVTAAGVITTVAGSTQGFSGDGGPSSSAQLNQPTGLAIDDSRGLLIADAGNSRVREVGVDGLIDTVAGGGVSGFSGDGGPATAAKLNGPLAVAVDASGNLFIADFGNYRVREVTADRTIRTVAGGGTSRPGDGGLGTAASIDSPAGVALDSGGNLFFTENWSNRVRKVLPSGIINTIAGNGAGGFSGDGGTATSARLDFPTAVATDRSGNLYIADSDNARVRKVAAEGIISTVAGGGTSGPGDGGPATAARLNNPVAVAVDASGNLFIADAGDSRIRKVTAAGTISTVAGNGIAGISGDGGAAVSASLNHPAGVAVDAAGNVYISDTGNNRIRKVSPKGVITTAVGSGTAGLSGDGGPAVSAQLNSPAGIALDSAGNLFIADYRNSRIRKVTLGFADSKFLPQVAVGGGYSTLFSIINVGATSSSGTIELTDQQGGPLSVDFVLSDSNGDSRPAAAGSLVDFVVPAGGIVLVSASNQGNTARSGWAQVASAGGQISVSATYERSAGGTIETLVGVLQSEQLEFATIPVLNDTAQDRQTAFAIANPTDQSISIRVALVGPDGTIVDDTTLVTLGPRQQAARYVWQEFARTNFKGSLVFRGQAGATFIVVALTDKQGLLTVIPVIPGKADKIPQ